MRLQDLILIPKMSIIHPLEQNITRTIIITAAISMVTMVAITMALCQAPIQLDILQVAVHVPSARAVGVMHTTTERFRSVLSIVPEIAEIDTEAC